MYKYSYEFIDTILSIFFVCSFSPSVRLKFKLQYQHLIQFVKKYDFLPIVIDHIAKPVITKSEIDQWKKDMTELSNASNVYCKFSGILTEVGPDYTKEQLDPYIDFILNTFGSDKLMWGSDWPVLTMADNYSNWFDLAMNYCNSFSEDEKNKIFSRNATHFYSL